MALTASAKTYTFDTNPSPDSAKYIGPAQTSVVKDYILLKRVAPKASKDFGGVARASEKTVKNALINGIYRDLIAETIFSYPVGSDAALVTALRADHSSLIASTPTQTLVDNAKISY
jgi:hypothetical protein